MRCRLWSIAGILRDARVHQVAHRIRHRDRKLWWGVIDLRHCNSDLRFTGERPTASQCFVGDDAKRINIGCGGCRVPRCLLGREVLHRAHDLTGRGQWHLVSDSGDTEVGDLHATVRCDQEVARLDVSVNESRFGGSVYCSCGLRDDVEHSITGKNVFALQHTRERFARNQLHNKICAAILLAVVEAVRNALVVDQSRVPGLCPEPLQKARVAEILVLQDLDGDPATNEDVCGLPHFTHATNGNARLQLVTTPECEPWAWSHFFSTASSTFFAIGAATRLPYPVWPSPPPFSTSTVMAYLGLSAGANPVNHRVYGSVVPFSAVPVFPATATPSILALLAAPSRTLSTIMRVRAVAVFSEMARPRVAGLNPEMGVRSGAVTDSTTLGTITMPPLAMVLLTIAI